MIEQLTRCVYRATTAGRCYLTKEAAVRAEARARIKRRYPTEQMEQDDIGITYKGFHWRELPQADKLYRRMCRLIRQHGMGG